MTALQSGSNCLRMHRSAWRVALSLREQSTSATHIRLISTTWRAVAALTFQDEKGTRKAELTTGTFAETPPIPWHELANVGDTTLQFIVIEKKYQPPQIAEQLRARRVRVRDPSKNKSPV
jgi:hypothetical protein